MNALTPVQKKELSEKFARGTDDKYCAGIDTVMKQDGFAASRLRYAAQDAQDLGLVADEVEKIECEAYWRNYFKVQPYELRRSEAVKQFAADWWTFKTIFESYDCPIHTPNQPLVEKVWNTSGLQTLTPIFFDINVQMGLLANPILPRLVADSVPVNSHTVTHLESTTTSNDLQAGITGEGAVAINARIAGVERTINLKNFATQLDVTYEVMRLQRTNFLARQIQRYAQVFANYVSDFALAVLIDGAGGSAAITDKATAVSGTPTYLDIVATEMDFTQGYEPNTIVAPKEVLTKILAFSQYQDPLAGVLHQTTGRMPNPLGMDLIRWDASGNVTTYTSTTMVMFDSNLSLIQYTEGGLITESENIIRSRWTETVTSQWIGFGIWDRAASRRSTGW